MIDKYLRKHNKVAAVIVFLVSTILGFYLLGNNLQAQWSIIDDHEIIKFLGNDLKVRLSEIPRILLDTEVGSPGKSLRYRPVYYTLRIFEAFLWGNRPGLWYLSRIMMFSIAVAVFWWLSRKILGFIGGFVFSLYLLTERYWSDIWNRLGPQESYGALGMALYFLGLFNLLDNKDSQNNKLSYKINLLLLTLGSIIAIGSKENLFILVFPTLYLLIRQYRTRNLNLLFNAAVAIVLTFALFMLASVSLTVVQAGKDAYQREINVVNLALFSLALIVLIGWIEIGGYILLVRRNRLSNNHKNLLVQTGFVSLILFSLYLSQVVFYRAILPTNTRYDFPGMLIKPLLILLSIYVIQKMLKIKREKIVLEKLNSAVLLFLLAAVLTKGFALREGSIINAANTQQFTRQIHNLVSTANKQPHVSIVFESHSWWDYEPVVSVRRFLIAYNVANAMYLRLHGYSKNSGRTQLERNLASQLSNVSLNGGKGIDWGFKPKGELKEKAECISIVFSGQSAGSCKSVVKL